MSHSVVSAYQTLGELLTAAADRLTDDGVADPPLTAELIAVHVLKLPRKRLGAEFGRTPSAQEQACLQDLINQMDAGSPAAYLIGYATFLGEEFEVTPDTLIPAPRYGGTGRDRTGTGW